MGTVIKLEEKRKEISTEKKKSPIEIAQKILQGPCLEFKEDDLFPDEETVIVVFPNDPKDLFDEYALQIWKAFSEGLIGRIEALSEAEEEIYEIKSWDLALRVHLATEEDKERGCHTNWGRFVRRDFLNLVRRT